MKFRQEEQAELMAILAQAGPKGEQLANTIKARKPFEIHIHVNVSGPILISPEGAKFMVSRIAELIQPDKTDK